MTKEERDFLNTMDGVADIENCWRTNGGLRQLTDGISIQYDTSGFIHTLENHLRWAGRILGLKARFRVNASKINWTVVILPKNGHASLMMQRYRQLYTERELSDDCGV